MSRPFSKRGIMPERILKSGFTVRTRLVPPHAVAQVGAQFPEPAIPKIPIKSVAGHTEMVTAPDDSPEWQAYVMASNERKQKAQDAEADFTYDYGIEAWKNGTGEWQTEPPADWAYPSILEEYGIRPSTRKRANYIRYQILLTNEDISTVLEDALGKTAPITNAEVEAASGGFQPDAKRRPNIRRNAKRHTR